MIKSEVSSGAASTTVGNLAHNGASLLAKNQDGKQNLIRQQQHQQQLQQQQQLKHRAALQNYHFASTSEEILKKYSKYPASMSLHIFETHYRFNNSQDSQVIPKDSPMIKDFMKHVLKEEIPVEMCELIKDFAIRPYDGCIILQVYDHRNMIKTAVLQNRSTLSPSKDQDKKQQMAVSKPRTYRTLLRPTSLSIYYDLLYHTDSALHRFTDYLSLQMESEILTATNRELNLSVPLNPYNYDHLRPEPELSGDESHDIGNEIDEVKFQHRDAIEQPRRKIHQDEMVLHKSSEYEELMLLLSNKPKRPDDCLDKRLVVVSTSALPSSSTTGASSTSTVTAAATPTPTSTTASAASQSSKQTTADGVSSADTKTKKGDKANGAGTNQTAASPTSVHPPITTIPQNLVRATGQFMRLRLIEEIRKKREIEKLQQEAKIQAQANAIQGELVQPSQQLVPQNSMNSPVSVEQTKRPSPATQNQPAPKRAKKETKKQLQAKAQAKAQAQAQAQAKAQTETQSPVPIQGQNSVSAALLLNGSNVTNTANTPTMNNQNTLQQPSQPQQPQIGSLNNNQQSQQQKTPQQTLQQQQQQQIFQNSLTPEEQKVYKQIQQNMATLAMMGQSGVTPTGQKLTPQQKQQAIQQAKNLQQQLFQRFPLYFQRMKQLQLIHQKRRLQQQQQASNAANSSGSNQNSTLNQASPQTQQFNQASPSTTEQPKPVASSPEVKKKRTYQKKKNAPTN